MTHVNADDYTFAGVNDTDRFVFCASVKGCLATYPHSPKKAIECIERNLAEYAKKKTTK